MIPVDDGKGIINIPFSTWMGGVVMYSGPLLLDLLRTGWQ